MMFKILVIQAANNLSDERTEFLINDRLSFVRFSGLGLEDRAPDARTIRLFLEKLTKSGTIRTLFDRFDAALRASGYFKSRFRGGNCAPYATVGKGANVSSSSEIAKPHRKWQKTL